MTATAQQPKVPFSPGVIVRCRKRDWVLLPSDGQETYRLRPLVGTTEDIVEIHKRLSELIKDELPEEELQSSTFPLPTTQDLSDAASTHLLWQAARLTLREGAAPFRSLGKISIRPRSYQFVPLMMAMRQDPVRLLIADDVGVGKTIEALLIARELIDRREIRSLCVLCPPSLCEQWQRELSEKFNLDAVVIRSGTIGGLERRKPISQSIYRYYPYQVASIDLLKTDRNRHRFLHDCPDLVIVDEAHGAARAVEAGRHLRHQLVQEIANREGQHLLLLSATPHSGIEQAFRSLLSLLRPEFGDWDTSQLCEKERVEVAKHFVQRTRGDIRSWEGSDCFPMRDSVDVTYSLSAPYRDLYDRTLRFCEGVVTTGTGQDTRRKRVQYWGALALLGCVMSSPAAARAALATRLSGEGQDPEDVHPGALVESSDEQGDDDVPAGPLASVTSGVDRSGERQLMDLKRRAKRLEHQAADWKLTNCGHLVSQLLDDGYRPIVWCKYVATADYVAAGLMKALSSAYKGLRVVSITGRVGQEERRVKIRELERKPLRVLVATDCLSEGINLQRGFSAAVHYDLPWNPNRLEQREGRVDRFGQLAEKVKAVRYYSPESPVDGVVLDVLLNKAREIHRVLGTYVPVPDGGETVVEALVNALFLRKSGRLSGMQTTFDFGRSAVAIQSLHRRWERDLQREKTNRTRFAQRSIKPEAVQREVETADKVLGDPEAVRRFVLDAGQRLGLGIRRDSRRGVFLVPADDVARGEMPLVVGRAIPDTGGLSWRISFQSPTPEAAEYVGRNHPFVVELSRYLLEESMDIPGSATAARCGVIRTRAVKRMAMIFLLRVRYLIRQPERPTLLAEEVLVKGILWHPRQPPEWLGDDEALRLLESSPDENVPDAEKQDLVRRGLTYWNGLLDLVKAPIRERAATLRESHRRVRLAGRQRIRGLSVKPQDPPDLIGLLVLQPRL